MKNKVYKNMIKKSVRECITSTIYMKLNIHFYIPLPLWKMNYKPGYSIYFI